MNTFVGVDNVREGQIILACKGMEPTGEVRQLQREKLRTGGRAIGPYFDEIFQAEGNLIRYHPWEIERPNEVPSGSNGLMPWPLKQF